MFDWSKIDDNAAIHCKTEEEAKQFLAECEKHGLTWFGGRKATEITEWDHYRSETVYFPEKDGICYSNLNFSKYKQLFEFSDLYKSDLPCICSILCPENPLKINEEFKVTNRAATYRIEKDGTLQYRNDDMELFAFCKTDTIYALINGTQHIIRRPQFSDDEKTMMRLLVKNGLTVIARDDDTDSLFAYTQKPASEDGCFGSNGEEQGIPDCLLRQITFKNSPFDAAAYLESEDKV